MDNGRQYGSGSNSARLLGGQVASIVSRTKHQSFIVADIETTGLSPFNHEIVELAALRVSPTGQVLEQFECLVQVKQRIPPRIEELTGITQIMVEQSGKPLPIALHGFLSFVGTAPMFFHNASFDRGFIVRAVGEIGLELTNPVHCTLNIARKAWPHLESHRLESLATFLDLSIPRHRALDDARTALGVLMAARAMIEQ
jgi:DNA polymerase-3 subunit epsilon